MTTAAIYRVGLNQEQNVLIDWQRDVRYVVFSPEEAMALAALLIKHAKQSTKWKPS